MTRAVAVIRRSALGVLAAGAACAAPTDALAVLADV
jgi:hypothetical protein